MRFECPATIGDADLSMTRPLQYNWNMTDVGSPSSYHDITTWQNHLSVLKKFERPEAVGIDLADSYQHRAFFEDVITKTADAVVPGTVRAGVLIYLPYDRVDECGGVPFGDSPSDEMRHRTETTINAKCVPASYDHCSTIWIAHVPLRQCVDVV